MKDWIKDSSIINCNLRSVVSEANDYYATDPKAVELLLDAEGFHKNIWEPACGEGHISKVLEAHGHDVFSTDLIYRGYGAGEVDFLKADIVDADVDIITNPPYKYARQFVEKALEVVAPGRKVAMFLKLTFLEAQDRRELFANSPPMTVYVSSARLNCGKNGVFSGRSAVAYAWFVWEKGRIGPTYLKWIN